MAVTKIRKISSWSLLAVVVINVLILAAFFLGGVKNPGEEMKEPVYTGLLLNWTWVLFGITVAATAAFGLWQFVMSLKSNPKSALASFGVIAFFAIMFFVTYSMGGGEPLILTGYEGEHNVSFWLKLTDMWLYSSYVLMVLIVVAVIAGSIRKALDR